MDMQATRLKESDFDQIKDRFGPMEGRKVFIYLYFC